MKLFLHKVDKIIHIQAKMQLSKEEYARKGIHNGCLVRIENSVTRDNCSASLAMPNIYARGRMFRQASRC